MRTTLMNRRDFSLQLASAGLALTAVAAPARAQMGFTEGKEYMRLATPVPTAPGGKIDVLEFFWYGCPHCNSFEPMLHAWSQKLPPDVGFRRVHVAFSALHETHAKIYYALEALGQVDAMHNKVFAAIHQQRKRLDKEADIAAFVGANGMDADKFMSTYKSFGVAAKVGQAKALTDGYKIDGVPSMGVNGRYFTSGSLAGGNDRTLAVADFLIERSRKGA
jgi:thiol:disulfide interchange protein DsbA